MAESLFTSQTPTGTNNSDGAPGISTGTSLIFAVPGSVTGVRFFATTTVSGAYTAALYEVAIGDTTTGTLLASKVMGGSPTAGAWNVVTFDSPVSVDTSHQYRAVIHSGAGRYVSTSSFFGSPLVSGNITAPADGTNPLGVGTLRNGTFEVNASLAYPADFFSASCYFVDVVFDTGGGGSSVAPDGVSVPVVLGDPALVWSGGVAPDGIAAPVALGSPSLAWSGAVSPDGVSVAVVLGSLRVSVPGTVVARPNTGTVSRPASGVVVRPDLGVVSRP
ncbi:DUF4082 domain-containing protein [Micromonospora sp. DT47]|uniref:DUF4082 domain-containing protein n=1 Tax=Micromonospora sp. DT47 TaxID=3393431 RepID=UPI003CFB59AE